MPNDQYQPNPKEVALAKTCQICGRPILAERGKIVGTKQYIEQQQARYDVWKAVV